MVIVLERSIRDADKEQLRRFLATRGFTVREIVGEEETIFGAVGSASIDLREVELQPGVVRVIPISKPYKLASREFKKDDTVVSVGKVKFGGNRIGVIAGPCAVESREQILETAEIVARSGAVMLRGGAYKPRSSPYSFQGLGEEGLRYLKEAGEATGLPVISEIVSPDTVDLMRGYVDVYQIGARNMQNFELLKRVGAIGAPVMLKRGLAATIEEWLMAAEYLLAHGAEDVLLCERGIRTFETYTRNSLDISSIPVVKKLSHLPVIVDPSHATGIREKVLPVGLAAVAAGADGLIVEVHPDPERALSDGPQTLFPEQFEKLMRDIEALSPVVGKEVSRLPVSSLGSAAGRARSADLHVVGKGGRTEASFQGERGAYSQIALERYFQDQQVEAVPQSSFRAVFRSVLEGSSTFGVVPIENSLIGSIHENYDLMLQYPDLKIIGETFLRIEHSLIGVPGSSLADVRTVYSQIPGLDQCREFLDNHPEWEVVPFYDTAGSVAAVAREGKRELAAIANASAAQIYGMAVLKEGIETNPRNYTRFAILARSEAPEDVGADKASLVFATQDKPGALFECMKIMAERSLNLKKIESRPIHGKPWEYMFYLDVEVPEERALFEEAIRELESAAREIRILGLYRSSPDGRLPA
ncbi:MAG: 3-deoxy-7-phosphoheptulonate synthase [Alkalispirochaetaceae bacterium]